MDVVLPGQDGNWEIGITGGTIEQIDRLISTQAKTTLSANGDVAIPGLIDAHIHLDKAYLLDRTPATDGTFSEALRETLRAKQQFTIAEIQTRAKTAIERAIGFGITAMRSHVEVDSTIELTGVQALLPLRRDYAWGITLQLAVFAQEGITNQPGVESLLHQAMMLGADAIGSAPYVDPDPEANIRIVFDIADRFDRPVDFHLDFLDDETPFTVAVCDRGNAASGLARARLLRTHDKARRFNSRPTFTTCSANSSRRTLNFGTALNRSVYDGAQ